MDQNGMSMEDTVRFFYRLYGPRNKFFLNSLGIRLDLLLVSIMDVHDAYRKGLPKVGIEICLARVMSRIFCVTEAWGNPPLVQHMMMKFPAGGCSYCGQIPCSCAENRSRLTSPLEPDWIQRGWSIRQWQEHNADVYGEINRAKGMDYIFGRLCKEYGELKVWEVGARSMNATPQEAEIEMTKEVADCIAWTNATGNFFDIDIEAAIWDRYGNGCIKCKHNPCTCKGHSFELLSSHPTYPDNLLGVAM